MAGWADEGRLIRLVRKWRLPLLLLLAGLVALDVRGAMGIAANLTYAACIGNAADPARRLEACTQIIDSQAEGADRRATAYFKRAYAWSMEGDLDRLHRRQRPSDKHQSSICIRLLQPGLRLGRKGRLRPGYCRLRSGNSARPQKRRCLQQPRPRMVVHGR
nr:hypothetical protein [Mesorhizobium sp.]